MISVCFNTRYFRCVRTVRCALTAWFGYPLACRRFRQHRPASQSGNEARRQSHESARRRSAHAQTRFRATNLSVGILGRTGGEFKIRFEIKNVAHTPCILGAAPWRHLLAGRVDRRTGRRAGPLDVLCLVFNINGARPVQSWSIHTRWNNEGEADVFL